MQTEEEKQTEEEQAQTGDVPKKGPSLGYRLRSTVHRHFPRLIEHPNVGESRAYHEAHDHEDNEKTTPPADEYVDFRCVWAIELYTPAHVEQLLAGFQKLGWDKDDDIGRDDLSVQLQRLREHPYGGGWLDFGYICRPDSSSRFASPHRVAPLPSNVEYATGTLFSLTSSLTCVVMGFIFKEDYSSQLDLALRTDRKTYMKPLRRGHEIIGPKTQKADHVNQTRADARRMAGGWFTEHLPGLFASGILGGEFPTCEFVTLRKAQPFPDRSEGSDQPPPYLSILDMDLDIHSWVCPDIFGLKFTWPLFRDLGSRYHAIMALRETDFVEKDFESRDVNSRSGQTNYVDNKIKGLLSRWSILQMLAGYAKHINAIRDSTTLRPKSRHDPLKTLQSLGGHISYSVDIAAVTAELIPYAKEQALFERGIETFKPCHVRYHAHDEEFTIAKGLAFPIDEQATWLQRTDQSLRDHLTQYGSLLGATENIRTQRKLGILTIAIAIFTTVIMILTTIMVWNEVIMVWNEVKSRELISEIWKWCSQLAFK